MPAGQRSWGGGRGTCNNSTALLDAAGSERTEFLRPTNANTLMMAQLETARAIENLTAILEVEGIDAGAGAERPPAVDGTAGATRAPRCGA